MNNTSGPASRLQRLVRNPEQCYQADCEAYLSLNRLSWAAGIGRSMLGSQNGLHWWQTFLLSLAEPSKGTWLDVVTVLCALPRSATPSPAEKKAGQLRFSAQALRSVREGLCADSGDQNGAAYAWILWRSSAVTGLRMRDLRRAKVAGSRLVTESGDELLKYLSTKAREICQQLQMLREQTSGSRGEAALFAAAERAWDRASATLRDGDRPLLASARHLSIAVWRNELDDAMLAVLLGEEEADLSQWGWHLLPGSEMDSYRVARPLRRAERKSSGGNAAGRAA